MTDDHDDIDDADWWKRKGERPAPETGPARAAAGPFSILLIAGPCSGRRITVLELSEGELIHLGEPDAFAYYVRDEPGSRNYYHHPKMSDYFNANAEHTRKLFAGKQRREVR
jgi:hypothetical protein